ncbi:glycosyltransferase 87 family protein [Streptomyces sp. NPDC056361]|uniref:glycosyltransferase 87 family protein n=1 Tax=Streptomyces sp. NPDC056361 TaxID=3345795 RepID=UPI0035D7A212
MPRASVLTRAVLVTSLVLAALTTALLALLGGPATGVGFLTGYAAAWGLFAVAVLALRRAPVRAVVPLVLAGAVAVAATGLVAPPRTSTDSYRYAWDGRVQSAGISPYDHSPADDALTGLRDPWLFPGRAVCARGGDLSELADGRCTRINRPTVHTIYPPVAEGWFLLVHAASPSDVRHKALQTGGAALSLAVTGLLLLALRRRGDPRRAAWWAWCPAVSVEGVNNAHVDVLAVFLSVAALVVVVRRRAAGGALLGLAIAAKLLPVLLVPGALSGVRRPRTASTILGATAATVAAVYLPYVLLSHGSVLGYLGGYAEEEGYDDAGAGGRYSLLRLVLPDAWALPAALLGLAAVSALVIVRGDAERPWKGALVTTGTAFLLLTPGYSWYALLLVALVALDGRWEWSGVALAGAVAYLAGPVAGPGAVTAAYGTAALAVCVGGWWRRRPGACGTGRKPGTEAGPAPRRRAPTRPAAEPIEEGPSRTGPA